MKGSQINLVRLDTGINRLNIEEQEFINNLLN